MDLQNTTGGAIAIANSGVVIPAGGTKTNLDDAWLQDEGVAALVTAGDLVATNYDTAIDSKVVQPEVAAALAASHTHANQAELDLLTDGDHDVSDGSSHADVATNSAHVAMTSGNPHQVTPAEAVYAPAVPGDWAGSPADLQAAVDRLAAQLAIVGAAPIP